MEVLDPKPQYKRSMFRRAITLVAVPICFGVIVLIVLNQLSIETEKVSAQERYQEEVVTHLNSVIAKWSFISSVLLGAKLQGNPSAKQMAIIPIAELQEEFAQLKSAYANAPNGEEELRQLQEIYKNEMLFLERSATSKFDGPKQLIENLKSPSFTSTVEELLKYHAQVREILQKRWESIKKARIEQDSSMNRMRAIVYGGILMSVLLSVSFSFAFSNSITKRLRTIISKSERALGEEKLSPSLIGDDEIAYVDKMICQAADKLQEAEKHRQLIVGMVAHDIASPLTAAQINLELVQENTEAISYEIQKSLAYAIELVDQVIAFVRELLQVHKLKEQADGTQEKITLKSADANFHSKFLSAALICMLTPVLIQLAFLLFVNSQLSSSEDIAIQLRRLTNIKTQLNFIKLDMGRAAGIQSLYLISGSPQLQKEAEEHFSKVKDEYQELKNMASGDQSWEEIASRAESISNRQIEALTAQKPNGNLLSMAIVFAEVSETFPNAQSPDAHEVRMNISQLEKEESEELKKLDAKQQSTSTVLSKILVWSILGNSLIALGMVLSFSSSITQRLEVLMANTAKLGKRGLLDKTVGGQDELAHLDAILHRASVLLEEFASERASRMSSMAERVRVPLNKSLALLAEFDHSTEELLPDIIKNRMSRATKNISAVLTLLSDLFTLDAVETGMLQIKKSDCDIRQVIDEAIQSVTSLASQKEISITNNADITTIRADKSRLEQVLINYLNNAIKFSENGKSIDVSTQRRGEFLRVLVRDQGTGIDQETAQHVFEKFFQGANAKLQGFGLGLSVCQLIAENLGGQVGVESQLGSGSTFWIEIPY